MNDDPSETRLTREAANDITVESRFYARIDFMKYFNRPFQRETLMLQYISMKFINVEKSETRDV